MNKVTKNQNVVLNLTVSNADSSTRNGVDVKVKLPKEMEFDGDTSEYSYDKNNHIISCKANLDEKIRNEYFTIPVKLTAETNNKLNISATATFDGKEVKSNTIEFNNSDSSVLILQLHKVQIYQMTIC